MTHPVDELQRFGVKVFIDPESAPHPGELVPVFHRWIQTRAVDQLLIDVADYTHLLDGPRVLLVGHEGNYALDYEDGRPGLVYWRKQPLAGPLAERLAAGCRAVFMAGRLLEGDPALRDRFRLRGDQLQIAANDRLHAPSTPETEAVLRPAVSALSARLYDGAPADITCTDDGAGRLTLTVKASTSVAVDELLARLG